MTRISRIAGAAIALAILLLTVSALPTTNDCDLCISIIQAPASTAICWSPRCRNMTNDITTFLQYNRFSDLSAEEMCAELNYCVEFDLEPAPVIIAPEDNVRWVDLLLGQGIADE